MSHQSIDKFIFLDVDGVFNYIEWWNKPEHYNILKSKGQLESHFDPECVENFNYILDKVPDVKVILTTSWKSLTPKELNQYGDYPEGIVTVMKNVGIKRIDGKVSNNSSGKRDLEIIEFIDEYSSNPYIFAIIDDDDYYSDSIHKEELLPRFIQTDYLKSGLTRDMANEVVHLLQWRDE